jgi:hypothetical protein
MLGGLDANTGDPHVGWDTDQFMTDARIAAQVLAGPAKCARRVMECHLIQAHEGVMYGG